MTTTQKVDDKDLYDKIKILSNPSRFKIYELCKKREYTITELSSSLGIAYNKCSDYVRIMEKKGLVIKDRLGKEARIKSSYVKLI